MSIEALWDIAHAVSIKALWYIAHADDRSVLAHSLTLHLVERSAEYATVQNYGYLLVKSALLDSLFGLRETVAGLVNVIFDLGVDDTKQGSTWRILEEAKKQNVPPYESLRELVAKHTPLDCYLEAFRHPYVHREDLSKLSDADLAAAIIGDERPSVQEFISRSNAIAKWLEPLEKTLCDWCWERLQVI